MAAIDDFKANLIGGGARANQYRVTVTSPPGIAIGLDVRRASFLVTASNLPAQTLAEIAVPFRGRQIYIAGDRSFEETWSTTFMNDTDFMIRNAMERWSRSAWPTTISSIELTNEASDAIETFEVTWRYQHFEASGVNF